MQARMRRYGGVSDGHTTLLVTGEQTQGRFALVETLTRRTEEPPLHSHTQEDELIYVVHGEITVYLDGNRLQCPAGSCVFLPKGSEHTYCIDSEEARLLMLLIPAGLEGYFEELNEFCPADQYIEQLITVSARYGVNLTGSGPLEDPANGNDPTWHGGGDSFANQQ